MRTVVHNSRWVLSAGAMALAIGLLQPAAAMAQDDKAAASSTDSADDSEADPDEIVVVGSTGTNISGVKAVGSEAVVLDREAIQATGMTNAADVVRTLPQVRNLGEFREGGTQGGNNNQQGNAINLRGLGQAATLLLIDGHRIANTGASQSFTEANAIPLAALERIELVADGASAVYGSDAVAGVVNYIIRKDYEGLEASYRMSNNNGGWEYTPSITGGTNWNLGGLGHGNIIVSYEYSWRDAYRRSKNPYLRQDLSQFGGQDGRLNGGTATPGYNGNIVVAIPDPNPFDNIPAPTNPDLPAGGANTYYGLPTGSNENLTVGDLLKNQPNILDSSIFNDYIGEMKRHQVTAYVTQELGSNLEAYFQGTYNHRSTISQTSQGVISTVSLKPFLYDPVTNLPTATPNPYYIAGLNPGQALSVQYNMIDSVGLNNWTGTNESYNLTGGLRAKLGRWKADAYYTFGRDKACNYCQLGTNINPTALQYQIDIGAINPLNNVDAISPDIIAKFTGDNIQRSGNGLDDAAIKFDGPLFALPAGDVRAAIGGERNKVFNYNINGANRPFDNTFQLDTTRESSLGERTIWSAFGEIYLPVVSSDMDVPAIRSLTLSGAVRYDHYSDVGSTTNPKISGTWELAKEFTIRGSWGTSFRAPNLPDVNPGAISTGATFPGFYTGGNPDIPFGPINIAFVGGANPDIKPEKATNWQIGADFKPTQDLQFSATYYNIKYNNRISSADVFGAFFAFPDAYPNYLGYSDYIHPINNPLTCVNGDPSTYDPVLAAYAGRTILYGGGITNPCGVNVLLDARNTNLAATKQDGIDAQVNWFHAFDGGWSLNFNGSVNKVLNNKEQVKPGDPFIDKLGLYSSPISWRGRASLALNYKEFSATLFGNYTGSYTNDRNVDDTGTTIPSVTVSAYTTFDLNLGYTKMLGEGGFMKSLRVSANIQNIADRGPELVYTSGSVFNAAYTNPFGRTFTLQVTTGF